MLKRACAVLAAVLVVAAASVYLVYFHRPPTANILARNRAARQALHGEHPPLADYDEDYDDSDLSEAQKSERKWNKFITRNHFVSIGELYDKCDGDEKIMQGKVVMLEDEESGGIKARTYLNVTFKKPITGGEMFISCKYNGKDLYSNHWDLCTVEEGMSNRIIFCPIKKGHKKYFKDMPIPNYLPKGRYETKAWLTNQDDEVIGCAYSDFTI